MHLSLSAKFLRRERSVLKIKTRFLKGNLPCFILYGAGTAFYRLFTMARLHVASIRSEVGNR